MASTYSFRRVGSSVTEQRQPDSGSIGRLRSPLQISCRARDHLYYLRPHAAVLASNCKSLSCLKTRQAEAHLELRWFSGRNSRRPGRRDGRAANYAFDSNVSSHATVVGNSVYSQNTASFSLAPCGIAWSRSDRERWSAGVSSYYALNDAP